jgi:hypothetical protein
LLSFPVGYKHLRRERSEFRKDPAHLRYNSSVATRTMRMKSQDFRNVVFRDHMAQSTRLQIECLGLVEFSNLPISLLVRSRNSDLGEYINYTCVVRHMNIRIKLKSFTSMQNLLNIHRIISTFLPPTKNLQSGRETADEIFAMLYGVICSTNSTTTLQAYSSAEGFLKVHVVGKRRTRKANEKWQKDEQLFQVYLPCYCTA